jgi:hypothetical protein
VEPSVDLPVASNFHGSVAVDTDMLSFAALVMPPFSMGYHFMSPLVVELPNGTSINSSASSVLYSPHTGYRFSSLGASSIRPLFELNAVLAILNYSVGTLHSLLSEVY